MARPKKGKLFNLFKDSFRITFFYKPSMSEDDIFYYIILDDEIKLKLRLIHEAIVIDDVIPLTTSYLAKSYEKMIELLVNQSEFTVLVSLIGNATTFSSACIKYGAPVIEDYRFITVPMSFYNKLKEYYKDDKTKYGFYLLAVRDFQGGENQITESIEAGNVPIIDQVFNHLKTKYGNDMKIISEQDTWELGKLIDIKGFRFQLKYFKDRREIQIYEPCISTDCSYFNIIDVFTEFENFCKKISITIVNTASPSIADICNGKGYIRTDQSSKHMLFANRMYSSTANSFGSFKIDKL